MFCKVFLGQLNLEVAVPKDILQAFNLHLNGSLEITRELFSKLPFACWSCSHLTERHMWDTLGFNRFCNIVTENKFNFTCCLIRFIIYLFTRLFLIFESFMSSVVKYALTYWKSCWFRLKWFSFFYYCSMYFVSIIYITIYLVMKMAYKVGRFFLIIAILWRFDVSVYCMIFLNIFIGKLSTLIPL